MRVVGGRGRAYYSPIAGEPARASRALARRASVRSRVNHPRRGEHNLAKPNFGYQKRQKELEKKRKKEEKLKTQAREERAARAPEGAPPRRAGAWRSRWTLDRRRLRAGATGVSIATVLAAPSVASWPPTCSPGIPRSGTGRSLRATSASSRAAATSTREWSCGRHRNIEPGSRAFLVRLGVAAQGDLRLGRDPDRAGDRPPLDRGKGRGGHPDELHHVAPRAPVRDARSSRSTSSTVAAVPALSLGRALVGDVSARDHRRCAGGPVGGARGRGETPAVRARHTTQCKGCAHHRQAA